MTPEAVDQLAARLFSCIERGDIEGVGSLYAPDVEVWHNVGGQCQSREQNLGLLTHLRGRIDGWRYEEIRREVFAGGFVQQHVLRARARDGAAIEIPVCIVVRVRDGLITRIDEYLDARAAAPLFAG